MSANILSWLLFKYCIRRYWDIFKTNPRGKTGRNTFPTTKRILRFFTHIIIFLFILVGSLLCKSTLLLITANMRKNVNMACSTVKVSGQNNQTQCVRLDKRNLTISVNKSCDFLNHGEVYLSEMCDVYTVRWIWAGILVVCTPYVCVFFYNLFQFLFKRKINPTLRAFVIVST